jgi:hypothetical protein
LRLNCSAIEQIILYNESVCMDVSLEDLDRLFALLSARKTKPATATATSFRID